MQRPKPYKQQSDKRARERERQAAETVRRRERRDKVRLVVEVLGAAAIVASIWQSQRNQEQSGEEMRTALEKIGSIAASMKEQTIATNKIAIASESTAQSNARTSEDFKRQTTAIIKQADALINSAQSTVVAASAQLASAQANTKTAEAGAKAAEQQLRTAVVLAATRLPSARLDRVVIEGWDSTPKEDGMVAVTVKPRWINIGGGNLVPGTTTFSLIITRALPSQPPVAHHSFGGNDVQVAPNSSYSHAPGFEYKFSPADVAAVKNAAKAIFVWGATNFTDIAGTPYRVCYGAVVMPPTGKNPQWAIRTAGPAAYHCSGG